MIGRVKYRRYFPDCKITYYGGQGFAKRETFSGEVKVKG
jgi:hypothetical protein